MNSLGINNFNNTALLRTLSLLLFNGAQPRKCQSCSIFYKMEYKNYSSDAHVYSSTKTHTHTHTRVCMCIYTHRKLLIYTFIVNVRIFKNSFSWENYKLSQTFIGNRF